MMCNANTRWLSCHTHDSHPRSGHRVSVWMGRLVRQRFSAAPYRALIEDPFDSEDNAARTLGVQVCKGGVGSRGLTADWACHAHYHLTSLARRSLVRHLHLGS